MFSIFTGACGTSERSETREMPRTSADPDIEQFEVRAMPQTAADPDITEYLPIGPHQMELKLSNSNAANKMELSVVGYIDLPQDYDLRGGCSFELEARTLGYKSSGRIHSFRKAPGSPAWRRAVADDTGTLPIGEWFDSDSWEFYNEVQPEYDRTLFSELVFLPVMMSDLPGTDSWCNLRRIDQLGTFTNKGTGRITWSPENFEQIRGAYLDAWILNVLTASGFRGSELTKGAESLQEALEAYFQVSGLKLTVKVEDGTKVLTAGSMGWDININPEPFEITMRFTPTEKRNIPDLMGVKTYPEKLKAGDADIFELIS